MLKMTTYPGMSLGGEVRESISLDDDDISDVEDEVFIRDGKNSYKMAEELTMKRPLMAPRRKLGKPDITSRLKAKPPCKAFCKPCCYILAALALLIGLIVLVIILVSIFPLPLDKLRDWVVTRTTSKPQSKLLPCSNLKVTNIWTQTLPLTTSESPLRLLDVNGDGIEDAVFGFGTDDKYTIVPPDLFCGLLGVQPPCKGGLVALNGVSGGVLWRFWTNDTIFALQCSRDFNGDGVRDCLATGVKGTIVAVSGANGTVIWKRERDGTRMEVFVANLVEDVDNDGVWDVIAAHTWVENKIGHLVLISGKTGKEIRRVDIPNQRESFYMPQTLHNFTLFGSGGEDTPGNLSIVPTKELLKGNMSSQQTIYADSSKGILTESVLVDITGDNRTDIITSMYNSTIVAINGAHFTQIWNYTISDSICNAVATPAFFNNDNISDFLVFYQHLHNITQNHTRTFIIDGKSGKAVYENAINGSDASQPGALTLSMESHGFDMFLFWTQSCTINGRIVLMDEDLDCGSEFNKSLTLNALNQYDQPPGLRLFTTVNKTYPKLDYMRTLLRKIRVFSEKNSAKIASNQGQSEIDENYREDPLGKVNVHKYGSSSFRHKDREGVFKNVDFDNNNEQDESRLDPKYVPNEYDWPANMDPNQPGVSIPELNQDYNYKIEDSVDNNPLAYGEKQMFANNNHPIRLQNNNRDPRSKGIDEKPEEASTTRKLSSSAPKYGVYDYKNVKQARNRLLHDLENVPSVILKDNYFKNRENQLRKSRFEQRDIVSHKDKAKENQEVKKMINEEKKRINSTTSFNLWDLESEKEIEETRENNKNWRGGRQATANVSGDTIKEFPSIGAIVKSLNATNTTNNNTIDIIFITYWQPTSEDPNIYNQDIIDCISEKLSNISSEERDELTKTFGDLSTFYRTECLKEQQGRKRDLPYFNQMRQLRLGQMTVYRIRIECGCDIKSAEERCAQFQPKQRWPNYFGEFGNGFVADGRL